MSIDPFTPWQEDPAVLEARTVGRDDALLWLTQACDAFIDGRSTSWCLVTGARGTGKSHLLQLVRQRIANRMPVRWVGEHAPTQSDPDRLWQVLQRQRNPWGWAPEEVDTPARRLFFVEGLDRLLMGLKPAGRWTLRHHLVESGAFLVGTALGPGLAAGEGDAFFGQFDTWRLTPLPLNHANDLFFNRSRIARTAFHRSSWEPLIKMMQGNPRALVALAEAAGHQTPHTNPIDAVVLRTVRALSCHYGRRFHDLSPLGQRILWVLAQAPRALRATEVKSLTGASSAHVATTARAMESAQVLLRTADPSDQRVSRYAVSETLFRFWLELQNSGSWAQTRAAQCLKQLAPPPAVSPPLAHESEPDSLPSPADLSAHMQRQLDQSTKGPLHPELEALRQRGNRRG